MRPAADGDRMTQTFRTESRVTVSCTSQCTSHMEDEVVWGWGFDEEGWGWGVGVIRAVQTQTRLVEGQLQQQEIDSEILESHAG